MQTWGRLIHLLHLNKKRHSFEDNYLHCVQTECKVNIHIVFGLSATFYMLDREGLKDDWRRFLQPFTFGPMWQLQPLFFTLGVSWLQQLNLTNQVVWMSLIMTPERLNTWDLPHKCLHPSAVALDFSSTRVFRVFHKTCTGSSCPSCTTYCVILSCITWNALEKEVQFSANAYTPPASSNSYLGL